MLCTFKYRNSVFPLRCTSNHSSSTVTTNVNSIVLILRREWGLFNLIIWACLGMTSSVYFPSHRLKHSSKDTEFVRLRITIFNFSQFHASKSTLDISCTHFLSPTVSYIFFYLSHEWQFHCSNQLASVFRPHPPNRPIFFCTRRRKRELSLSFTYLVIFVNLVVLYLIS